MILSGGLDSSTLLWHLLDEGKAVDCVTFDYGQRHRREIDAARVVVDAARGRFRVDVGHDVVDLSAVGVLLACGGSALVNRDVAVPDGHYADESMKATVVPNRNMIMLALAGGIAVARGANVVAYAAHAGDHAIYPDCREVFASAVDVALRLCDWREVGLSRPFVAMTKTAIAARAIALDVPVASTWSCYKGGSMHCGTCGTCVERREALGDSDPTKYEVQP